MILKRIKSKIVAHISYFIGSETEAIVVDPRRDCQVYVEMARRESMRIKYVFETHRNEDYVVGSKELAHFTGAQIYHGPWPDFGYGRTLKDGQKFKFGKLQVTAIHTPGHTPGCVSYAIVDLNSGDETVLICSGDALFVNDVGRTDFGGPDNLREWAENLYDSIFNKLLPLGDHVILCPAHGAGSVCGRTIATREWSTLGLERLLNPILQLSKKDFIEYKIAEHSDYAPYFRQMEKYNVEGAPFVGCKPSPQVLTPKEFKDRMEAGALAVDTRSSSAFAGAHIQGVYSIPIPRLSLVGWLLPYNKRILLLAEGKDELLYATRSLVRIGYDNIEGYMELNAWFKAGYPFDSSGLISVDKLKEQLDTGREWTLLDVRNRLEWDGGHLEGAFNIFIGHLQARLEEVPEDRSIAIICKTGNRSSMGASILLRGGRRQVYNLLGGMEAWTKAGYPISKDS